jgi:hypothetical protein
VGAGLAGPQHNDMMLWPQRGCHSFRHILGVAEKRIKDDQYVHHTPLFIKEQSIVYKL